MISIESPMLIVRLSIRNVQQAFGVIHSYSEKNEIYSKNLIDLKMFM